MSILLGRVERPTQRQLLCRHLPDQRTRLARPSRTVAQPSRRLPLAQTFVHLALIAAVVSQWTDLRLLSPGLGHISRAELTRYLPKKRVRKEKLLIGGSTDPLDVEHEDEADDTAAEVPIVSYWHQNLTLGLVTDRTELNLGAIPPEAKECASSSPLPPTSAFSLDHVREAHIFAPFLPLQSLRSSPLVERPLTESWVTCPSSSPTSASSSLLHTSAHSVHSLPDRLLTPASIVEWFSFWNLRNQFVEINETTTTLPIRITLSDLSHWKFMLYSNMGASLEKQAAAAGGSGGEMDELKRMLIEVKTWVL